MMGVVYATSKCLRFTVIGLASRGHHLLTGKCILRLEHVAPTRQHPANSSFFSLRVLKTPEPVRILDPSLRKGHTHCMAEGHLSFKYTREHRNPPGSRGAL